MQSCAENPGIAYKVGKTCYSKVYHDDDPLPRLGFLRGVFLANHLASNDKLTRTTKRQNTQQLKLTIHKKRP